MVAEKDYNVFLFSARDAALGVVMKGQAMMILCVTLCAIGRSSAVGELARNWQYAFGPSPDCRCEVLQVSPPGPIRLASVPVRVALRAPTPDGGMLSAQVARLRDGRRFYLFLRGLHSDSPPGVTYHLYLDLSEDVPSLPDSLRHLGILSFFDTIPFRDGRSTSPVNDSWRSFEVTDLIQELYQRRLLTDSTTVTILTFGKGQEGADPTIDSMALVVQ